MCVVRVNFSVLCFPMALVGGGGGGVDCIAAHALYLCSLLLCITSLLSSSQG